MDNRQLLPVALAVAGFVAIVVGIYQGLIHVAPGYEGRIMSGWGGELNHEELLLARVGVVGIVGAVAALRWKRLSLVPVAMGGVVLFYALRALVLTVQDTRLYAETTTYGGDSVVFILGAEPFLLLAGGGLLVSAGVVGWRYTSRGNDETSSTPSTVA